MNIHIYLCLFVLLLLKTQSQNIKNVLISTTNTSTNFYDISQIAISDVLVDFGIQLNVSISQTDITNISSEILHTNYQYLIENQDFQNSIALSAFTKNEGIVQFTLQRSSIFSDETYNNIISLQPSIIDELSGIVQLFNYMGRNSKVSVICCYDDSLVKDTLTDEGLSMDLFVVFRINDDKVQTLQTIKDSKGINILLLSHDQDQTTDFLLEAEKLEIYGGQFLWISTEGTVGIEKVLPNDFNLRGHIAIIPSVGYGEKYERISKEIEIIDINSKETYIYDGIYYIGSILKFIKESCNDECPCEEDNSELEQTISVIGCVSPKGATGLLSYTNRNTRSGGFDIYNWNEENQPVKVALFSDETLEIYSDFVSTGVKKPITLAILLVNNVQDYEFDTKFGEKTLIAYDLALTIINNNDSVLPDHTLFVEPFYYANEQEALLKSFQISNIGSYPATIGCSTSSDSSLTNLVFNAFDIPQFSGSATSSRLSDDSIYGTFGRNVPSDDFQSKALARLIQHFGWKRVATINSNDDYGTAGYLAFAKEAQVIGLQVEGLQTFQAGVVDPEDLSLQMDRLKRTGIRVMFLFAVGDECVAVFQAALKYKLIGPGYTWVVGDGCRLLPDEISNLLGGSFSALPWAGEGTKIREDLLKYIDEHAPKENDVPFILGEFYWDLVFVFANAFDEILKAGKDIFDGQLVLETIRGIRVQGMTGVNTFEHNLDRGSEHIQYTLSYYDDRSNKWINFGTWTESGGVVVNNNPIFSDHTNTPPSDLLYKVSYNTWDDSVSQIFATLTSFGIIVTVFIGVIIFKSRETRVVRAASPVFLFIILFGIFLGFCSLFPFLGKPTEISCILQPWLSGLAFVTIYSALLTKTYRIYRIFDNSGALVKVELPDSTLLSFAAVLLGIEIIINILWTSIDPIKPLEEGGMSFTDENELVLICSSNHYWPFLILYLSYKGGILLVGVILSWLSRETVTLFNESKQIAFSTYNIFFFGVILIPIFFVMRGLPSESITILSITFLLCNTGTLLIMFLPKIYIIYFASGGSQTIANSDKI